MRDFLLKLASCWCLSKDGKVYPGDEKTGGDVKGISANAEEGREDISVDATQEETRQRDNTVKKCPSAPMSQPRPSKSSSDVLVQLREEGVLPLTCQGDSVALDVPAEEPTSPSKRQSRRPIKLEKLEERLEEKRRKLQMKSAGSGTELERQLSNADVRRREILTERSRKLANRAAEQKSSGTPVALTSASDSDVIATRESRELKALEKRLAWRKARVAKKSSLDGLQRRQADALEHRKIQADATVVKAMFAASSNLSPVSEEQQN
ncbi:uncharacterized protein LOC118413507 isoform X1 [Branchiostoma floridae]|uniref:Uncharacterized protein LOC118413507 isoform X1 n=1 Tax=Branchiostoma floridae TaxID=7739 RepID=A0A9J7MMN7_BRAFL|nr:uncharacterized protein LOC118413507 isoform X1 [Branchiostoma floridae]